MFRMRAPPMLERPIFSRTRLGAIRHGPLVLDSDPGIDRDGRFRTVVRVRRGLRLHLIRLKGNSVFLTILSAVVTVLLFIYLFAALLRPEWF
jgi:K+-transporting ATPase KdpF subunit